MDDRVRLESFDLGLCAFIVFVLGIILFGLWLADEQRAPAPAPPRPTTEIELLRARVERLERHQAEAQDGVK